LEETHTFEKLAKGHISYRLVALLTDKALGAVARNFMIIIRFYITH
jgi:hypothetical protein